MTRPPPRRRAAKRRKARVWTRWAHVRDDGSLTICASRSLAFTGLRLQRLLDDDPGEVFKVKITEVL